MTSINIGIGLPVQRLIAKSAAGIASASAKVVALAAGSLIFGSVHGVRPHGLATLSHVWKAMAPTMQAVPTGNHALVCPSAAASRLPLRMKMPT